MVYGTRPPHIGAQERDAGEFGDVFRGDGGEREKDAWFKDVDCVCIVSAV
jgi:hypothetical protein